jgi:hypothetical protein
MNPIDDFFQEKLKNHEVKPSDRANQLFLSKLENKKKKKPVAYWYFGLAASLFIVSFVGVYYYKGSKSVESTLVRIEPTPTKSLIEKALPSYLNAQNQQKTIAKLTAKPVGGQVLSIEAKMEDVERRQETPSFSEKITLIEIAKVEPTTPSKTELNAKSLEETLIFLTPILAMNQVTSFTTSHKVSENINNAHATAEYFADDKSLLTRVLDEVKNLKKGEKVDFNKLGFRPIEELALDKEGFIVSETNQIKDKINWIRTRLNNN